MLRTVHVDAKRMAESQRMSNPGIVEWHRPETLAGGGFQLQF